VDATRTSFLADAHAIATILIAIAEGAVPSPRRAGAVVSEQIQ